MNPEKMNCKRCKKYRNIYIHPWSKEIPEELKRSTNGFACILPNDEEFIESFNGREPTQDDLRIDIMIGKDDSIGCENFEERDDLVDDTEIKYTAADFFNENKDAKFIIFDKDNQVLFGYDMGFYKHVPQIPFMVNDTGNSIELIAPHFGILPDENHKDLYGNGSILVSKEHFISNMYYECIEDDVRNFDYDDYWFNTFKPSLNRKFED